MQISSQNYVLAFVHHKYEYAYTRLRTKINLWMHVGVYMTLRTRLNNEARIHRFIALRWVNSKKKKTRVNHFPTTVPLRSSAYFKWNWSFQQFRLCSASFLTSRDRSASPFSSLFFFRSRNHRTPRRTQSILYARNHVKPRRDWIFSRFVPRDFMAKSVSDLDEWKLFRLTYWYICSCFIHDPSHPNLSIPRRNKHGN